MGRGCLIAAAVVGLAGCGDATCTAGTKETAPGVCHVPEAGHGAAGMTSTSVAGPSSQPIAGGRPGSLVSPVDSGGARSAGQGGHGGAGVSGASGAVPEAQEPSAGGTGGKRSEPVLTLAGSDAPPEQHQESGGAGAGEAGKAGGPEAAAAAGAAGMSPTPVLDPPKPRCGDGRVDSGETCDGDCQASCDDSDPCTTDRITGSAAACNVVCLNAAITTAVNGDHCCPRGANAATDNDCSTTCGDGVVTGGETCDGNCPTSCDDGISCTSDKMIGSSAQCTAACTHTSITAVAGGDGCCPRGSNANSDSDCAAVCGNGVKEPGESCDGDCPVSCDDGDSCTQDVLVGGHTCNASCTHSGPHATPEICDGVDNNCNGHIDEGDICTICPRPNALNVVHGAGFESGLDGWQVDAGSGSVSWVSADAVGCSMSGSAKISLTGAQSPVLWQCVNVQSSVSYNFGAHMQSIGGGSTHCRVDIYAGTGCSSWQATAVDMEWLNTDWSSDEPVNLTSWTATGSARVYCYAAGSQGLNIDMVYLTAAPGKY
jgi:hypothetical protein